MALGICRDSIVQEKQISVGTSGYGKLETHPIVFAWTIDQNIEYSTFSRKDFYELGSKFLTYSGNPDEMHLGHDA